MVSQLILVRHGESEGNLRSTAERAAWSVGTQDYALTARGQKQARITGEWIAEHLGDLDLYKVSYYRRAQETARLAFPQKPLCIDPRLAERNRGLWHVLTEEKIAERYPEEIQLRDQHGPFHYRPRGGESQADVQARMITLVHDLSIRYENERVVLVGHADAFGVLRGYLDGLSIQAMQELLGGIAIANTSVTIYEAHDIDDRIRLRFKSYTIPWEGKL